jgi:hypothetical protein
MWGTGAHSNTSSEVVLVLYVSIQVFIGRPGFNSSQGAIMVVIVWYNVVGFTTAYPINAYRHYSCEFESHSW